MGRYFHGGYGGLKTGALILPPTETGAASCSDYGGHLVCRRDRVYVTTDLDSAIVFAAMHHSNKGKVYQVEPLGELDPDPDCKVPGQSFSCERAAILAVRKITNKQRRMIQRALLRGE